MFIPDDDSQDEQFNLDINKKKYLTSPKQVDNLIIPHDDSEFTRQKLAWANYMNGSAHAPEIWCSYQRVVSAEFAVELNALLDGDPCD